MSQGNSLCLVAFMRAGEILGDVDTLISSLPFGESERERLLSMKNPVAQKNSLSALLCLDRLSKRAELDGEDLTDALLSYVIRVADGEKTKNEANKYEEISIFKDGVTL